MTANEFQSPDASIPPGTFGFDQVLTVLDVFSDLSRSELSAAIYSATTSGSFDVPTRYGTTTISYAGQHDHVNLYRLETSA